MRFPWQRKPHESEQAVKAVKDAADDWPRIEEVAEKARELRVRNGFAEALIKAMGGPTK